MSEIKVKKRITPTLITTPGASNANLITTPVVAPAIPVPTTKESSPKKKRKTETKKVVVFKASSKKSKAKGGPNKWVEHVKEFAKVNSLPYACALASPFCSRRYKDGKDLKISLVKKKKKKGASEADEAQKHLAFLNKQAGGDYEGQVAKRRRERMEGGGIGASFIADLEKKAAGQGYGKGYKGFK